MSEIPSADGLVPARREARLLAFSVDALILSLAAIPFAAAGGLAVLLQSDWLAVDPSGAEWAAGYGIAGLWLLAPLVYHSIGTMRGGTVGARLLGLTVRRTDGGTIRRPQALLRAALLYPSLGLAGLGLLAAMIDRQGRSLPDRLAGTCTHETAPPPA